MKAPCKAFLPGAAGTGYASTGTVIGGVLVNGGGRGGGGANVTVNGPFNATGNPVESPSRAHIFVCRAPSASEEPACASRIMANLARKAFRRPVTDADLAPLMKFYAEGRKVGAFENGVFEDAMVAMLSSAKLPVSAWNCRRAGAQPGSVYKLNGLELASRLSFFLWSSIPDEELLAQAEQGKLSDSKVLEQQVRRMLADPRARNG